MMDVMTHRAALCVPRLPLLTFTFHFLFYPNREHRQVHFRGGSRI